MFANSQMTVAAISAFAITVLLFASSSTNEQISTGLVTVPSTSAASASLAVHRLPRHALSTSRLAARSADAPMAAFMPVAAHVSNDQGLVMGLLAPLVGFVMATAVSWRYFTTGCGQSQSITTAVPQHMAADSPWCMASVVAGKPLEGKVVLVTGASRGIGAAIAKALGEAGATVIGTATSASGAEAITAQLQAQGVHGEGMALDVTNTEMIKEVAKTITDKFGAPSIVVNNAGITRDKLLVQMKEDDWDAVINTNLSSVFHVTKAFQRSMTKARWGRIISVSSIVGSIGNMGQCNYAAAKAGIEGFTRAAAREMASRNVTVNAVAPGFIETDMTRAIPEEWAEKLKTQIPLGRMGSVEDVANAVVFLALPSSGYITGQTLHVNGGMHMN